MSASGAGAGRGNVNPALIRPRRSVGRHMYVAPDNPDNPIVPTGGSVLQDVRMPAPTFDEYRRGTSAVDAIIANSPMSAPRGPRPERDAKGVARDALSIAGNTGVQAVKPFVDVANIPMLGALDPVSRFFGRLGRSYTDAASPTTRYDAETLARMPEGATLEKLAQIVSNPGLALNMGAPSVGSLFMPLAAVKAAGLAMPKAAAALGDTFSTGAAVTGNALMNAGDTFSQTQGDIGSRLAAALGSGAASALVGRATGGGLEGQLARRGGMPTPGGILKSVGKESTQEFGENSSNQLAQDTGEGNPLNFAKAIDEGTIGAILAPLVAGPVNLAQYAGSPERRNANLLARAIEADAGNMPTPSAGIDNSIRFGPVATPAPATAPRVPAPPVPRLPYDSGVQNPQTPIIADTQGKARLMSADEFLDADTARAADESIGLTPDVRRATAQRQATPEPTPQAAPSDLVERLRAAGWTPPQEAPPKPQPQAESVEFPDPVKPRPLTVERGMEILDAGKSRALIPQERGYLDELKRQIGPEDFQLLQDSVQQPFKVSMADRKFRVPKISEANRAAVAEWDTSSAPKPPAQLAGGPTMPPVQQPATNAALGTAVPRGAVESPPVAPARPVASKAPAVGVAAPASPRAIEQTLLTEGRTQTRYMGNKREFFQQNARFIARNVAPLTQQADTLFDMYAGGGTYGLTTALSGAMPNVKRVVVNEVDPVRAARFRLAAERGAEIMSPWRTDPKLRELADKLRPLIGKSSTPAATAMAVYQGHGTSSKYASFKRLREQHGEQSEASNVARLALHDVFFSGRTASWDRLMNTAAQDAGRIRELAQRARDQGIAVEVTSHDSLGREAVDMVRNKGGNSVVMLDPPYHTTTSGTYSAVDKQFDFASDDFLVANMDAARQMADGNVVLYNNKDTPLVRKNFSDNFGGSIVARGWKRQNGQREYLGVYDGRGKSGNAGLRVGDTGQGVGTGPPDGSGRVLDRTGGNAREQAQANPPRVVQQTGDQAAGPGRTGAAGAAGPAGARRPNVGRLSRPSDGPKRGGGDETPMDVIPADTTLYHGTAGKMRQITPDSVIFMTTDPEEAAVYAVGMVPGTSRGSRGNPNVLRFVVPDESSVRSIDAEIEVAIMDGDVDETVAEELTKAKADGDVSFLRYTHPSGVHGGSMQVYVPVYPHELLDAGGQDGLFSVENAAVSQRRTKSPEVADIVELRKRESVLKSLRKCLA